MRRKGPQYVMGARVELVHDAPPPLGVFLRDPADSYRFWAPLLVDPMREQFAVAGLNVRHRVVAWGVVSVGCLTSSLVHPREVFTLLLGMGGVAGFVLAHNHPSGDPEPSGEDVALTRRLAAAGVLMGMELLDHTVVGAGRYVSMKERGML
jgi:DNA repair protein RadC